MTHDIEQSFGMRCEIQAGKLLAEHIPVVPLARIPGDNGRGPRTDSQNGRRVLPDFMAGAIGFVEVKTKAASNYFRNWDRYEHGIDKRLWDDYRAVEQQFQKRVVLLILEMSTGDVLAATLDDLAAFGLPRFGVWSNNRQQSINWHRDAFTIVGKLDMPDGLPEGMTLNLIWPRLQRLTCQLALPFEETIHD